MKRVVFLLICLLFLKGNKIKIFGVAMNRTELACELISVNVLFGMKGQSAEKNLHRQGHVTEDMFVSQMELNK